MALWRIRATVDDRPGFLSVLTASLAFWVIPYKLIFIIALLLVVGFFVLRRLIRGYNRRVVERAQQNSKK